MQHTLTEKLIRSHVLTGNPVPGAEIGLRVDQTLTQDATGTLVMLELEALGLDRVRTELSAQYVDHNLLQQDFKNADDHLFLRSACQRFGVWYSRPGNGVSHPLHNPDDYDRYARVSLRCSSRSKMRAPLPCGWSSTISGSSGAAVTSTKPKHPRKSLGRAGSRAHKTPTPS